MTIVAQLYARRSTRLPGDAQHHQRPSRNASDQGELLRLAANVALANKRKKNSNVVVAFSGAAATTHDYWLQALKFAARRSLPIIFVVENNPWAVPASVKPITERGTSP